MKRDYTYRLGFASLVVLLSELLFWGLLALLYLYLIPNIPALSLERYEYFPVLAGSSILGLLFLAHLRSRKKAMERLVQPKLSTGVLPGLSTGRQVLHYLLWRWAIAFLILALMNPRFGKKEVEVRYSGIDLMICLDVSNSMLAEDISPNRLLRARRAISQLLDKLHGDRIGLIVFAGDAYVQLPITTDYEAAEMFLSSVSADMVPTQGTAIGKAIYLALNSFGTDNTGSRSIIVITDGENHEDDAVTAATQAYEQGVIVHTIGMGSVEGAPLPIYDRGIKRGFKKDKEGNTVMSKLNEDMLTQVGSAGGGIFVRATNADVGLDLIVDEIEAMTENEFGTEKYADHEDRFQIFLLAGLVMLCLDVLLSYHQRKMLGIEL